MDDKNMPRPPSPGIHPPSYSDVPRTAYQPGTTYQPVSVTTMNVVQVGPNSTGIVCPSCHATILTRVDYVASTRTHIIAGILCLFICWPCVCLPYCIDSCKNADHYCPNCNAFIGTYKT